MKRLETMNILEVLGEVGYIIKVRDIGTCISDSKVLSEFIKKESECDKDFSKFMSFLQENEKYIDKQKLILNAIYNCNEILEQIRTGKIY